MDRGWWAPPEMTLGFMCGFGGEGAAWMTACASACTTMCEIPLVEIRSLQQQPVVPLIQCEVGERGAPGVLFDTILDEYLTIASFLGPLVPETILCLPEQRVMLDFSRNERLFAYCDMLVRVIGGYVSSIERSEQPSMYLGTRSVSSYQDLVSRMPDLPSFEEFSPEWFGLFLRARDEWYILKCAHVGRKRIMCFPAWRRFLSLTGQTATLARV